MSIVIDSSGSPTTDSPGSPITDSPGSPTTDKPVPVPIPFTCTLPINNTVSNLRTSSYESDYYYFVKPKDAVRSRYDFRLSKLSGTTPGISGQYEDLVNILGIVDTYHDFGEELDAKYMDLYRDFYKKELTSSGKIITGAPYNSGPIKDLLNSPYIQDRMKPKNVNNFQFREALNGLMINVISNNATLKSRYLESTEENIINKLVENFKVIFHKPIHEETALGSGKYVYQLQELLLDDKGKVRRDVIITVRQPFYFLINSQDGTIAKALGKENIDRIKFIINVLLTNNNKTMISTDVDLLANKIATRTELINFNKKDNVTYPVTFISDQDEGLDTRNFNFNLDYSQRDSIDPGNPTLPKQYTIKVDNGTAKPLDVNKIDLTKLDINIQLLGSRFYVDNGIVCEYKDKSIKFKIKTNKKPKMVELCKLFYKMVEDVDNIKSGKFSCHVSKLPSDLTTWTRDTIKERFEEISMYDDSIRIDKYGKGINFGKIINIDTPDDYNLYDNLLKIANKYPNKNDFLGCVFFLIFGAKRFGDWAQGSIAKKYYFVLQSNDFYCLQYARLIGAPLLVPINNPKNSSTGPKSSPGPTPATNILYNYLPPDDLLTTPGCTYLTPSSCGNKILYPKETKALTGHVDKTTGIPTPLVTRDYFNKYIKYKNKYLQLKKQVEQFH